MSNLDIKMAELNKKFKSQIINVGTDIMEVTKIPFSSPRANYMTYGGIPVGKMTEFFGGEGSGKTTSALDICSNAQHKFTTIYESKLTQLQDEITQLEEKGNKTDTKKIAKLQQEQTDLIERGARVVVYVDAEQTLDTQWAELLGVDTQSLILVRPEQQTAEQVLQIIIELIATGDVGLVVLDSIPMLVSQNIYEESLEKKSYGGISQALTTFCSKVTPYLTQHQCAFIGINQIREDLSSMYNNISTPGGRAWKHGCSLRLQFKKDTLLDSNNGELTSKAENPGGNKVAITIMKTKCCKPDRRLGYYTLNYTTGIDVLNDAIELSQQYRIVERSGSWYSILDPQGEIMSVNDELMKFQGMPKLLNYLRENDAVRLELYNRLNRGMNVNE